MAPRNPPTPLGRKRGPSLTENQMPPLKKLKGVQLELLQKNMLDLTFYKSPRKVPVTTSFAPTINRLNDKKIDYWGLVYHPQKGATLHCVKKNSEASLWDYALEGCVFDDDAKEPECFLLLKNKVEEDYHCVGLNGEWTLKLDQEKTNKTGWREELGYKEGLQTSTFRRENKLE